MVYIRIIILRAFIKIDLLAMRFHLIVAGVVEPAIIWLIYSGIVVSVKSFAGVVVAELTITKDSQSILVLEK
jgi:hypothetical protein